VRERVSDGEVSLPANQSRVEEETLMPDRAFVRACNVHVALEMSFSKTVIISTMKKGCTRIPTTKSVEASKESPILDL